MCLIHCPRIPVDLSRLKQQSECNETEMNKNQICTCFSQVLLFATLWTLAHQAPLSMGFSKKECWSGLPCPPPDGFPEWRIEPASLTSPALAGRLFTTSVTWEAPNSLHLSPKENQQDRLMWLNISRIKNHWGDFTGGNLSHDWVGRDFVIRCGQWEHRIGEWSEGHAVMYRLDYTCNPVFSSELFKGGR